MLLDISVWGAFVGGIIVFFSPCILPIVPFYLSYMAGVGMNEITADGSLARGARLRLIAAAVMFSLGMMTVFTILGAGAFAVSTIFKQNMDWFRYFAAAIVFIMGLHFLGVYRIGFLDRTLQMDAGDTSNMTIWSSYLVGFAFMAGWTPCVGGVLTGVFMMASTDETAWQGLMMVVIFGAGVVLPFILAALFTAPFMQFAGAFKKHLGKMEKVMGALLVVFAILIITGSVNNIANWMLEMFPGFTQI
ncbi:cytochrome c biogenesis protein CcdA [Vannielia sp.]|uniref:cytochrome c biogenesis CcdA family protein n=1 Tax=Vannielia sp. TaxID=2813045 RepID=UPI0026141288|nr:cytochrome c biogenesis protein CcdA [Vannielia sp.]MDF1872398.1 cytochrome c biogenesis protein CcdA [Vannielia sp.]